MQVFILGAGKSRSKFSTQDTQIALQKFISGHKVLDWTLYSLHKGGIDSIIFIGGYEIEKVIENYPELQYCVNPRWKETHVLGSLKYGFDMWKGGDVLFMYADTVFRPEIIKKIILQKQNVVAGVDFSWRDRIGDEYTLITAEKVKIKDDLIDFVGRSELNADVADGQFSGLLMMKKEIASEIHKWLHSSGESIINGSMTELLDHLLSLKVPIIPIDISNKWAEIDSEYDLARFVFGTKAETLHRISPFVKNAIICDQIHFNVANWKDDKAKWVKTIQKKFSNGSVIIRSSSIKEDSWHASQAGAFKSLANINPLDSERLTEGIDEVVESFGTNGSKSEVEKNQVLVQPFIKNISMSGVVFSSHLENGTPYYIINYDEDSNRTDIITSGSSVSSKSIAVYKNGRIIHKDKRIKKIINAVAELEKIIGHSSLDIEFVINKDNDLFIVQVRPITIDSSVRHTQDFDKRIGELKLQITNKMRKKPHIYGDTTIFSDMTDWNPAEMIGTRPNPLALSLYQYLITNSVWRIARDRIGYHNPIPEKLLYCLAGHPYIDVRNSFNNLIPQDLSPEFAHKLVNHYLKRLKKKPYLHDKVEFDILITCYAPDFEYHVERLRKDGFSEEEISHLREKLLRMTNHILTEKVNSIDNLINKTEILNKRRQECLNGETFKEDLPSQIAFLLDDCIEYGTIPFSALARYGFIANTMLKGLVRNQTITEREKDAFLNSIETIAGKMVHDMNAVLHGNDSVDEFLKDYGHLRPGTYDILSYSYDERPEYYFPDLHSYRKEVFNNMDERRVFEFSDVAKVRIDQELRRLHFDVDYEELFNFIKKAIAGREYAKFQFTKNVSQIIKNIISIGKQYNFTRFDMAYLFIEDILRLQNTSLSKSINFFLKKKMQEGREWYETVGLIETPQIIFSPDDLDVVEHNVAMPNFVTSKIINSPICDLAKIKEKDQLKDKIILTEGADPGFDWIFLHQINGLITKYGGAASHMTIRCAEFGLPAAIGCGEELYERLKDAKTVELNCTNKNIRILG